MKTDQIKNNDFQKGGWWIFITLTLALIGATPSFNKLILNFVPNLSDLHQGIIKIGFVMTVVIISLSIWWKKTQYEEEQNKSDEELLEESIKEAKWLTLKQHIFKRWPLNIITLKVIPLIICWIIERLFINRKCGLYHMNSFDFPEDWENYTKITSKFFKRMFRVTIQISSKIDKTYEVKFGRDFKYIEIRWTNENYFNEPKKDLYENIFSENNLKHIKIFTWVTPFGLYWNLRRFLIKIKKLKLRR